MSLITTLGILFAIIVISCGVCAIVALRSDSKALGGGLLCIASIALIILVAISLTGAILSLVVAGWLCNYAYQRT